MVVAAVLVGERVVGRLGFAPPAAVADSTTARKNSVKCEITEVVLLIPDLKLP